MAIISKSGYMTVLCVHWFITAKYHLHEESGSKRTGNIFLGRLQVQLISKYNTIWSQFGEALAIR